MTFPELTIPLGQVNLSLSKEIFSEKLYTISVQRLSLGSILTRH